MNFNNLTNPFSNTGGSSGGGGGGAVDSVNGMTGDVTITKTSIGLGNVNNTSDLNKPVSTATQTALDLKQDKLGLSAGSNITLGTVGSIITINSSGGGGAVDSVNGQIGVVVLDKISIGLSNVDNTSDLNKPISSATQAALDLKSSTTSVTDLETSTTNRLGTKADSFGLEAGSNIGLGTTGSQITINYTGPTGYPTRNTYSSLPPAADNNGAIYTVLNPEGIWLVNRKEAGTYRSDGSTWNRLGNWIDAFNDDNFSIFDGTDISKIVKFSLNSITTLTTRLFTFPDKDGTIALTSDITPYETSIVTSTSTLILDITNSSDIIEMTNALAASVIIPTNSSVPFSIGTIINISKRGTGALILSAEAGVTLDGVTAGSLTFDNNESLAIYKKGTNEWVSIRSLTASTVQNWLGTKADTVSFAAGPGITLGTVGNQITVQTKFDGIRTTDINSNTTIANTHLGKRIDTTAGPTLTIPTDAIGAWNTTYDPAFGVYQADGTSPNVAGDVGVTIQNPDGVAFAQYKTLLYQWVSANTWVVS